ncbi:MAG: CBS domain-containing protein [Arenicellales bacterium]
MSAVQRVSATTSVEDAMHKMREADVSYLLVEPAGDEGWGIMTKRDVIIKIVGANKSTQKSTVEEIASRPLITAPSDASLREVSLLLSENSIRRVVIEDHDTPVGVVSDTDLFDIVEEFGWETEE